MFHSASNVNEAKKSHKFCPCSCACDEQNKQKRNETEAMRMQTLKLNINKRENDNNIDSCVRARVSVCSRRIHSDSDLWLHLQVNATEISCRLTSQVTSFFSRFLLHWTLEVSKCRLFVHRCTPQPQSACAKTKKQKRVNEMSLRAHMKSIPTV